MAQAANENPLVEMDGDEMTAHPLAAEIKEELLEPYIDLKTEYYDWACGAGAHKRIR